MPRIPVSGSIDTTDVAKPIDVVVGDVKELVIQVSVATVRYGSFDLQPISLSAGAMLGYQEAVNPAGLYVRSASPGVPGTVSWSGFKEV